MSYCNKCGKELSEDSMFCNKCGAKVSEAVSKRICSNKSCGNVLDDNLIFCDKCGTKYVEVVAKKREGLKPEPEKSLPSIYTRVNLKVLLICMGIVGVIDGVVLFIAELDRNKGFIVVFALALIFYMVLSFIMIKRYRYKKKEGIAETSELLMSILSILTLIGAILIFLVALGW